MRNGPINGVPPHLKEEDVPEAKPEWRHQWLYSAIPVSEEYVWWQNGMEQKDFLLQPFLTGYCRNCGKAFSQKIQHNSWGYSETIMNIPQTGCVGPA